MDLQDAYQQQLSHWRASLSSGAHRIGWKIGFNPPAVQEKLGLAEPVVGHLTSATLLGADGSHSLAGAENALAEPEIAIEIGPDHSIAGLAPAIEIVDMPAPPEARIKSARWWPPTSFTARWRSAPPSGWSRPRGSRPT
ncbi:MAG: hypothetical protein WKF40_03555 [Thermoleophilaceae bacterium]